jgi:threonine/homoserine/homoserine lactone efflux protein
MWSGLAAGVVFGLSAGLAPGPLLALIITQTLRHGAREGMKVALAPLVTDLPIVVAAVLVASRIAEFHAILGMISLAGGSYLVYLAWETFRSGTAEIDLADTRPQSLRKGALVNALSPHPYLFWATVGAPFVLKTWHDGPAGPVAFIAGFYALLLGSKMVLAVAAGRSRGFLKGRGYVYVLRGLAVLLVAFALILFRDAARLLAGH